jgi:threonine dehydratase
MSLLNDKGLLSIQAIDEAAHRIQSVVQATPFLKNFNLSKKYNCNIYLKREDMQIVRSFKIRGAYNKISTMSNTETSKGIVCASAGNHAQGVAFAASRLHIPATIFMPTTTPKQKISKVRYFGSDYVNIVLTGDTFDDTYKAAIAMSNLESIPFIHPFDDYEVMAGQGTVAKEMLSDINYKIDILLVAVGGGGLISGVGSYIKQMSPTTKIIAVESEGAPALYQSIKENKIVTLDKIDSFADGIAVKRIGDKTYDICKLLVDEYVLVPEGKICSTILSLYNDEAIVVEPAGAISIAALDNIKDEINGKNVAIIICGGNNDITRTEEIRERALLWENKKHYFIIRFPQRAGALREFLHVLGPNDDITHFEYTKKNNRDSGPALVGIELKDRNDFDGLIQRMNDAHINFEHINNNPMLFEMLV